MERKLYIDELRGLAIFIVIIGHSCEFSLGESHSLFNYIYYSFHMPLFMFICGLVAFQHNNYTFKNFLLSKCSRLLIPFFSFGILSCLARNINILDFFFDVAKKGYWFLPVLFEILIAMFLPYKLLIHYNKSKAIYTLVYLFPLVAIILIYKLLPEKINGLFSFLFFIKLYPFVFLGMLTSKYLFLTDLFSKQYVRAFLLVCTITSFCVLYNIDGPISLVAYFSLPIIYNLFYKKNHSKYDKYLVLLGNYSCELYVIHYFLLPRLSFLNSYFSSQNGVSVQF